MANRTVKDAHTVHGTNPQYLVEKIIRSRIYESRYWKEECFAVNEELLVERAVALKYIGGVHGGNIKPTPFLCLIVKMLQIQPAKDIIVEFIRQKDHKYARALGMFYLRLTEDSLECYRYLEPLYNDYRKLKRIDRQGAFSVVHMDEFVDELLREERSCDVILPRLQKRQVLEEESDLEPRASLLDEELQDVRLEDAVAAVVDNDDEDDDDDDRRSSVHSVSPPRRRASVSPPPNHDHRHRRRSRSRTRSRSRSPPQQLQRDRRRRSRSRSKSKSRSRSPVERRRKTGGDSEPKNKRKKDKKDRAAKQDKTDHRSKDKDRTKDKDKRDKDRSERKRPRQDNDDRGRDREQRNRDREADEIREANKLRAELGIPLLKP